MPRTPEETIETFQRCLKGPDGVKKDPIVALLTMIVSVASADALAAILEELGVNTKTLEIATKRHKQIVESAVK